MTNLPTLIFVPGSWHKPTCYDKTTKILQDKHKLNCVFVTLPSTTGNPAASFKDDIDAARKAISAETAQGRHVVVISHSYGGLVGNSAVKGFTKPRDSVAGGTPPASTSTSAQPIERSQTQPVGHVIGIILIASGFNLTGMAFMDPFFGHPPPSWRVNNETGYAELVTPPRELFYHDLPEDEANYRVSQLTTQSLKSLFEGGEFAYAGWRDVPAWYIGTIEDRGLPVMVQRMNVGMAREMGALVVHREMRTSHSPFLSQPERTAGFVVEAVEAFSGEALPTGPANVRGDELALPEARLLQPLTWFRIGLPLVFGRFFGRCVLIFCWGRQLWGSK